MRLGRGLNPWTTTRGASGGSGKDGGAPTISVVNRCVLKQPGTGPLGPVRCGEDRDVAQAEEIRIDRGIAFVASGTAGAAVERETIRPYRLERFVARRFRLPLRQSWGVLARR